MNEKITFLELVHLPTCVEFRKIVHNDGCITWVAARKHLPRTILGASKEDVLKQLADEHTIC
jgi:hypothetical protein